MRLLDAEVVKKEKNKSESALIEKIEKLKKEEASLIKRINLVKDNVALIKEKEEEFGKFSKELELRKSKLNNEIIELQKKRDGILMPIEILRREDEKRLLDIEKRELQIEINKKNIADEKESLVSMLEDISDRKNEAQLRELALHTRMLKVIEEENSSRESLNNLANQWAEYYKSIRTSNIRIQSKENELNELIKRATDMEKVNEIVRLENEAESKRLKQEQRAIEDKYRALEQAKIHLNIHGTI